MPESDRLPGKAILKIKSAYRAACGPRSLDLPELQAILEAHGVVSAKKMFPFLSAPEEPATAPGRAAARPVVDLSLIYELDLEVPQALPALLRQLNKQQAVAYAEPWYLAQPFYQPNDPFADTLLGAPGMWHLQQIMAQQGWSIQRNNEEVVVAVIDTGIFFEHEDLQDNLALNQDDPIDGLDNDEDGYVDNYRGWDLGGSEFGGLGDNDPSYKGSGHGVGVAGVFGARTDNALGTAGVCFNCKFLPIKGSSDDLSNSIAYGYQGIVYALEQGADIINCSWGSTTPTQFGQDVVAYATLSRQAAIIAAAGNSTSDAKFYPAAYDEVFSVANSSYGDTLCCNATYNYTVDLSAPGHNIQTPIENGGYGSLTGSSYAAPLAAGAVAVVKAHFPEYSAFQAAQRLRVTTDDVYEMNPRYIDKMGTGRVNLLRALTAPPKPSVRKLNYQLMDTDGDLQFRGGDTLLLYLDFINYLEPTADLRLELTTPETAGQIFIERLEADFAVGEVGRMETFSNGAQPFAFRLRESVPVDFDLAIRINYVDAAQDYFDFEYLVLRVNRSYLDITTNALHTTITSKGNFGFNDYSTNREGLGISFQNQSNVLFEGGLVIGTADGQVSDNIRNGGNGQDRDFRALTQTYEVHGSARADYEARATFDDGHAAIPLGIVVDQYVFAFEEAADENYVLFQYVLHNRGSDTLRDLHVGMFADWDIMEFSKNVCNYNEEAKLAFAYDILKLDPHLYGMSVVSEDSFFTFATTNPSAFGYQSPEKYQAISSLPAPETGAAGISTGGADIMHFVGAGSFEVAPGDSQKVAFALLGADRYEELVTTQARAQKKYRCQILGLGPNAGFSVADGPFQTGRAIQFTDLNDTALSWQWEFGDGSSAEVANPTHAYALPGTYTVSLTVDDGSCQVKSSQTLSVRMSTGLAGRAPSRLRLYPNPTDQGVQLALEHPFRGELGWRIVNLHGQTALAGTAHKQGPRWEQAISTASLPVGMYQLVVEGSGFRLVRPLVVQRF